MPDGNFVLPILDGAISCFCQELAERINVVQRRLSSLETSLVWVHTAKGGQFFLQLLQDYLLKEFAYAAEHSYAANLSVVRI